MNPSTIQPVFESAGKIERLQDIEAKRLSGRIQPFAIFFTVALAMCLAFYLSAWLADDAYIDFRVVNNIVSGAGPVWNIGSRVQVFTSPLWVAILSILSYLTRLSPPSAAYIASIVCDLTLVLIAALIGLRKRIVLLLSLIGLFCSQSFLDYSSSGLENPVLHLLIALICAVLWLRSRMPEGRTLVLLSLLCGLLLCARLDSICLVLPILGVHVLGPSLRLPLSRRIGIVLLGMAPLFLWECLSIFYYGSFLPNTALAKLPLGYPRADLIAKGFTLLQATAVGDPGTLLAIVVVPIILYLIRSDLWLLSAVASLGNLLYILFVGGDFMLGRFLSSILVLSWFLFLVAMKDEDLLVHSHRFRPHRILLLVLVIVIPAISVFAWKVHKHKFSLDFAPTRVFKKQVADERSFYFADSSLRATLAGREHPWLKEGEDLKARLAGRGALVARINVGMFGYAAGPKVFVVDVLALGDAFLSRLPSCVSLRTGHFRRPIPAGYAGSLMYGRNLLKDPLLAQLFNDVMLSTRAPLTAAGRTSAIVRLNSPFYRHANEMGAYTNTAGGVENVLVEHGDESIPCPAANNRLRMTVLGVTAPLS